MYFDGDDMCEGFDPYDISEDYSETIDARGMADDTLRVEYIDPREDRYNSLLGTIPCDMLPDSFVREWQDYMEENAENFLA